MIKVGITGAESPIAGEIMRLCQRHPDVEIVYAYSPKLAGRNVSSVHPGFIGEEKILFSSNFDATSLDVVFLFEPLYSDSDWVKLMADTPALHLVIFDRASNIAAGLQRSPIYGLSEMNRKILVRGAREAIVPSPLSAPVLIALYPIASHLLLNGDIQICLNAPEDLIQPENIEVSEDEIKKVLQTVQSSFNGDIQIDVLKSDSPRSLLMKIKFNTPVSVEELLKIYDSIYDDHNFTFVVTQTNLTSMEVESTNKVVINIAKPDADTVELTVVADPRMRGGAGEAIHIMNLFFGLHEKTGLDLKTSSWNGVK
ncbi:MAG: hypothetical protein K2K29_06550 [Muribaculaceae bacterium]|nr:hypothetical protein [Muribaculaceae bacterium]